MNVDIALSRSINKLFANKFVVTVLAVQTAKTVTVNQKLYLISEQILSFVFRLARRNLTTLMHQIHKFRNAVAPVKIL